MIHYHGTPMGGQRKEVCKFLENRHCLIPFPRPEDLWTAVEVCQSFVVENGAYTAWKSGNPVEDWTPYYQFVDACRWLPGFDWALVPDVIDGSEHENNKLLHDWCKYFSPDIGRYIGVPVWHYHESIERLHYLITAGWMRIALGSSGEYKEPGTRKWWNRTQEVMEFICDETGRPRRRLHGLRMLNPDIFRRLPLASADSTNVARNANALPRFGGYASPARSVRMECIASRIEKHQSATHWRSRQKYQDLWTL